MIKEVETELRQSLSLKLTEGVIFKEGIAFSAVIEVKSTYYENRRKIVRENREAVNINNSSEGLCCKQ